MRFFRRTSDSPENSEPESTPEIPSYSQEPLLTSEDPSVVIYPLAPDLPSEPVAPPQKRRHWLPFVVNWPALLLIVVLIALTVVALLINQGAISPDIVAWWPLVLLFPAALWFLLALLSRDARGLLGSSALFGLSASLLIGGQKNELLPTVVGITFIAAGAGIMLRGLLLRNQPIS